MQRIFFLLTSLILIQISSISSHLKPALPALTFRYEEERLTQGLNSFTLNSAYSSKDASSIDRVELGNERFLRCFPPELQNKRLGLVINQTSSLPGGSLLPDELLRCGHRVQAIFSPEHGFTGTVEGGVNVDNSQWKNIKIHSLYGSRRKPTPQQMQEIDAFVYDIQDVGTRFYTYITTLKHLLEAAAESGIPVYVLDRPNPAGGEIIEGPLLKSKYESFIGALPIPVRYGLTVGELARMMIGEGWVPRQAELHIVELRNWRRDCYWKDTGLPWIPPSPNIPTPETPLAFPGLGLLGGLSLNQGLGTELPFLQFGAPWLASKLIIQHLGQGQEFGIELKAVQFTPRSLAGKTLHPPHENVACSGIRIHIKEEGRFCSLRFVLAVVDALKKIHPDKLTSFSAQLNLLFGDELLLDFLKDKISLRDLTERMEKEESIFRETRQKYLIY